MARNPLTYEFGPFRLNPSEGQLLRDGQALTLTPKAFEALVFLIERRGHLVEKEELMKALWPDTFVEEANLAHHVWRLRKVLEESKNGERYIETIPKRGYRFIAPVVELDKFDPHLQVEKHTITRLVAERETFQEDEAVVVSESRRGLLPAQLLSWKTALIGLAAVIALSISGLLLKGKVSSSTNSLANPAPIRSLAVLPFKPLVAGSNDGSLELGMADALITRLSNLKELNVRPTSSVMKFASPTDDLARIGRELQVEAVLDGRIQRSQDRIRVTTQLIRSSDGKTLWAGSFDEKFTDIFSLEDSLSAKVASALTIKLTENDSSRIRQHHTDNIEAYEAYLKGRFQANMAAEGALKGLASYQEAINKDPNYALPYAGLADTYSTLAFMGIGNPSENFSKAKAAAAKALELDNSLAEVHVAYANILFNHDWDWNGAEREYKKAIELNDNLAEAHHWYSEYLQAMTRFDEGLVEIKRAQQLDPLSININFHYALCLFAMGRDEEALVQYRKTLDIDESTGASGSHWGIAMIYQKKGMHDDAIRELELAMKFDPRPTWRLTGLAQAYAAKGDRAKANEMLKQILEMRGKSYVSPMAIAHIYSTLGNNDEAFKWLDVAYNERESVLAYLRVVPVGSARSDPRFNELLKRMNLAN
jgi:DNA-binding winged helix-turn-helix (wHTH) protein/TolB-like protein/Flp pilus assembly protein TadD